MKKNCLLLLSAVLIFNAVNLFGQSVTNTNTGLNYSSIQAAIDAPETLNGHTLTVAAGVYTENVVVNKELTINGPKAGVDGNDGSRGTGEAIVYSATSNVGDGTLNGAKVFILQANNVTIDGFTIDGANPTLSGSGYLANGAYITAQIGIFSFGGDGTPESPDISKDNPVIKNNIIKNFYWYGIIFGSGISSPVAKYAQILHNKVQNVPYQSGIDLNRNYYATVEFNTVMDCRVGINLYYYILLPQAGKSGSVANNNITTKTQVVSGQGTLTNVKGIVLFFLGGLYNDIVWSIHDNTMSNTTDRSGDSRGIDCSTNWNPTSFTINNNSIAGFESGYSIRNSDATKILTITGGAVTNCSNGVLATNLSEYFGSAQSSVYNINQVTISNCTGNGILVDDESLNPTNTNASSVTVNANNCKINGNPNGVLIAGDNASASLHNNDLSGNASYAIIAVKRKNINPFVDATCNWYGHWSGPSNTFFTGSLGSAVSGSKVTFAPWLTDGTDSDVAQGFQSVLGSCDNNCGNKFFNVKVCHNGRTQCVPVSDAFIHFSHGDAIGACIAAPITNKGKVAPETTIPQVFKLSNAPNPFINSTTIKYELPFDSRVIIKVYDAMGKEVASFINGERKAGIYTQNFNAGKLWRGIYYYKLIAITDGNEIIQSGKMIKQ